MTTPPIRAELPCGTPNPHFERFLAASGTYLHITDYRTGRFRYVSPGVIRLLGYDPQRWRFEGPQAVLRATHPADRGFVREAWQQCQRVLREVASERRPDLTFTFATRMLRRDGSEILLSHCLTFPEVDATGRPRLGVTTLSDVSHLQPPARGLLHVSLSEAGGQRNFRTLRLGDLPRADFSRREEEVLQLVSEGLSSREIGARLHITYHTVCTHRKNLLRKAGVTRTVDLLRFAQRSGLLP